jgi:hypothetical protein
MGQREGLLLALAAEGLGASVGDPELDGLEALGAKLVAVLANAGCDG